MRQTAPRAALEVEWTQEAKDAALLANFAGECELGLTRDGVEITDRGYERQAITFSVPSGRGTRVMENTNAAEFGPWKESMPPITGWLVAQGDVVRVRSPFEEIRERMRDGDELIVRAGTLTVGSR